MNHSSAEPRPALSVADAVAIVVGVVVGAGIFQAPSVVAFGAGGGGVFILAWVVGGLVSLIGALCYAELATTYPHVGGDYSFLHRAYGPQVAFLFAWARLAVIQTGAIAMQAFVIGNYATGLLPLGTYSTPLYAAAVVVILTALNMAGLRLGKGTQKLLTGLTLLGLGLVIVAGGLCALRGTGAAGPAPAAGGPPALGLAMVFVLLTYGGWNEAAYLSAEVRGDRRSILRVLLWGIGLVTALYVLANLGYLAGLGVPAIAESKVVAADLMRRALGEGGAKLLSLLIVIAVLSTINGTIFTGARTSYALGRDYRLFAFLGRWRGRGNTPANALLVQGAMALALVGFGAARRDGFEAMVNYTSPVFWLFFLLVGAGLVVLRFRDGQTHRPFPVPLYPVLPLVFCGVCLYMLWSSIMYARLGAMIGVGVLAAGLPFMLLALRQRTREQAPGFEVIVASAPEVE